MHLFCPTCGRTQRYNDEVVGLMPKVCSCCIMLLEQSLTSSRPGSMPRTRERDLKPYGLVLVRN